MLAVGVLTGAGGGVESEFGVVLDFFSTKRALGLISG